VADSKRPDAKDRRAIAYWACGCARRVLRLFENSAPDDKRPREAIEAGRLWVRGKISVSRARAAAFAAHAAARDAKNPCAKAAARSAGHAAACAHTWRHAVYAAEYALASLSVVSAESVIEAERKRQKRNLDTRLRAVVFRDRLAEKGRKRVNISAGSRGR
jgi:hypothetical protein